MLYMRMSTPLRNSDPFGESSQTGLSLTYNQRSWDLDDEYAFHLTIATNLGGRTAAVHDYVEEEYDLHMELHATRMTVLDRRRML